MPPANARSAPPISSIWRDHAEAGSYPALAGDIEVDAAVLGAGIVGLTAAALLRGAGLKVAVVEMGRIGSGATANSTAKLTALQGTTLQQVESSYGSDGARVYATSNAAALERVARMVAEHELDCGFERQSAYTYAAQTSGLEAVSREAAAARRAGLPVREVDAIPLPWDVEGAVELPEQAQFNPASYLQGLARVVDAEGSRVYERTRATGVREGRPCTVETERGSIRAGDVIVATHLPILDRGLFFARAHPMRSYAIAARLEGDPPPGMSINVESATRSIRGYRGPDGAAYAIIGGEGHKVGAEPDTVTQFARLERFAHRDFPVTDITHRWSAQDYMPIDHVPYSGRLSPISRGTWVATGFQKWGLTAGTAAAMLITDEILGRGSEWRDLYSPARLGPLSSAPEFAKENATVGMRFFGDRLRRPTISSARDLAPDQGGMLREGTDQVGVYRDPEGVLHGVSLRCTHLGCLLAWNPAERSWDCPCHGSRFAHDGRVIEGPATADLRAKPVPDS